MGCSASVQPGAADARRRPSGAKYDSDAAPVDPEQVAAAAAAMRVLDDDPLHRGGFDALTVSVTTSADGGGESAGVDTTGHESAGHESGGLAVEEPNAAFATMRVYHRIAGARLHGIDGNPDQFNPGRESMATVAASERAVRGWFAEDEARRQADTSRGVVGGTSLLAPPSHREPSVTVGSTSTGLDFSFGMDVSVTSADGLANPRSPAANSTAATNLSPPTTPPARLTVLTLAVFTQATRRSSNPVSP